MNQEFLLCLKAITDAQISVAGFQAENQRCTLAGYTPTHNESDFLAVQAILDELFALYIGHVK